MAVKRVPKIHAGSNMASSQPSFIPLPVVRRRKRVTVTMVAAAHHAPAYAGIQVRCCGSADAVSSG